jgi:uncharacterized protein
VIEATSLAPVATPLPGRCLGQPCRHSAHRLPVTLEEDRGSIPLSGGTCRLQAERGLLVMRLDAADAAGLPNVVARHLLRFACRKPPEIRRVRNAA